MAIAGIDIGGTKVAVAVAGDDGKLLRYERFPTESPDRTIPRIVDALGRLDPGPEPVIGIACGGPLDAQAGLILAPPNLPGWDRIPINALVEQRFGGRAFLMNDANAGTLAEWRFGAGVGCRHLVALTMGTGMGSGIICDGRLYEGANGNAGEIGHIRLTAEGPIGYGKAGSVEGWCSGGGIARQLAALGSRWTGAKDLNEAAAAGDETARRIFADIGTKLGRTIAIIIDLLNPEVVVLGPVYRRCQPWIEPAMRAELEREALPASLAACRVVPSPLGERSAEYQAIAVAIYHAGGFRLTAERLVDSAMAELRPGV